ncbi:MAG: molecular chaperone [Acetatifactor sp.]
METNRMEQMEALETMAQFNDRLLHNLPTIIDELSGGRKADTDAYLKNIVEVIGWEISVMNAVSDLLAESGTRMDKERFNQCVLALNTALASGEDAKTADALRGLIPHFETLAAAAKEVLA